MKISVTYTYVLLATAHFQWQRREQEAFIFHILTADELSMHSYDPEMKCQHAEWHVQCCCRRKLFERVKVL
jgi:hypothetical protein